MISISKSQAMFLRELMSWDGIATPADLKSIGGSLARRVCKERGLVTYDGTSSNNGYWRITDAGRAALAVPNGERK
jgi:hypothetical protein